MPAFIQSQNSTAAGATTLTATYTSAITDATHTLLAFGFASGGPTSVLSVTDPTNGTWTKDVGNTGSPGAVMIGRVSQPGNGTSVITLHSTSTATLYMAIWEVSGLAANPLDQTAANLGVSAAPSSGATASSTAGDLVVGWSGVTGAPGTWSAGASFTLDPNIGLAGPRMAEYLVAGASGTQTATFTTTNSVTWQCLCATYFALKAGMNGPAILLGVGT